VNPDIARSKRTRDALFRPIRRSTPLFLRMLWQIPEKLRQDCAGGRSWIRCRNNQNTWRLHRDYTKKIQETWLVDWQKLDSEKWCGSKLMTLNLPYDHHSPAETQVKPDLVLPDHLRNSEGGLNWIMGRECCNLPLPVVTSWLVVWNIFVIFPNSWDDDPIWLILFFQGGRNHQLASQ